MFETVTVEEAIKRGNRMVNYPVMLIMAGVVGLSFFLGAQFKFPAWTIGIVVLAVIVFPWIYWSFMITKWRIWAFENVRNVHQLKRKAIDAKLIWQDGSFWEKTEIRTQAEKDKIKLFESKFDQPDILIDDYTVPFETVVRYSKVKSYGVLFLGLVFVVVSVYLFIEKTFYVSAVGMLAASYIIYTGYKNGTNTIPQVIINDQGIQTIKTPFHQWQDIRNEDVIREGNGKSTKFYFVYYYPGGSEQLEIAEYDITKGRLEHLLNVYRARSVNRHARLTER